MRKHTIMLAAAPLALLAACGDGADEEAVAETDMAAETTATDTSEPDEVAPTKIADAGDVSGAYSFTGEDGATRSITLNAADTTYSYTDDEGVEQSGTYTVTPDGYRIYLSDYYGSPGWFIYRNDALDLIRTDFEVPPDVTIPGDRYQRDDDDGEMPSRRPELGSSVDRDQQ